MCRGDAERPIGVSSRNRGWCLQKQMAKPNLRPGVCARSVSRIVVCTKPDTPLRPVNQLYCATRQTGNNVYTCTYRYTDARDCLTQGSAPCSTCCLLACFAWCVRALALCLPPTSVLARVHRGPARVLACVQACFARVLPSLVVRTDVLDARRAHDTGRSGVDFPGVKSASH